MVEKISVQIQLEGGAEVQRQLADIGEAGQKAFADISKSAEQAGGFKNLKPEEVTKKLEEMGVTGADSIKKIQDAVKSAATFESLAKGVAAVESAFKAVAIGAGLLVTGVTAAAAALRGYTSEAAKVAQTLRPLADLSGQAFESVSALQIAFAQGGTSAEKFASTFIAIEQRVQEAAITTADDIEQSALRVEQAHLAEEQAVLGVEAAELNLRRVRGLPINPIAERRLKIEQAEAAVTAARLAQAKAEHEARVAEANDLRKIITLYQQLGRGASVAFDPLTTQATKTQALLATLARAGNNWKSVLADILQASTELERIQIGKALGLDPAMLATLSKGSAALRQAQEEAKRLGLALTETDNQNLRAFTDSWNRLTAIASAALEKIGAALAPLGTMIANTLSAALVQAARDVQTLITELQTLSRFDFSSIIQIKPGGIADQIISGIRTALNWLAANSGLGAAIWDAITTGANNAAQAVLAFAATLPQIGWDAMVNAASAAFGLIKAKILELLGLGSGGGGGGNIETKAQGGLLGGRGTGTSDSNLAWVSRGEHIMPARAVAQPGVLVFLEALRRSGGNLSRVLDGMGRFAFGGLVPRPAYAFAAGGPVGGMSNVTINFPGTPPISGLRASAAVVDELRKAAALAQVRSGGRKPSRYS